MGVVRYGEAPHFSGSARELNFEKPEAPAYSGSAREEKRITDMPIAYADAIVAVIVVLAYLIIIVLVGTVVEYFFGKRAMEVFAKVSGFPFIVASAVMERAWRVLSTVVVAVAKGIWSVLTLPWRYRAKRLLVERADRELKESHIDHWMFWSVWESTQQAIDRLLSARAESLDREFKYQEQSRHERRSYTLRESDRRVVEHEKRKFWELHALFRRAGYRVRRYYRDYLSDELVA